MPVDVAFQQFPSRELRPTTRYHYRVLLDTYINPAFGEQRIDRISVDDVNDWYDHLAPGRETIRAQAYSLLRTILTTAASTQPQPLIPFNPGDGCAIQRGSGLIHSVRCSVLTEHRTVGTMSAWMRRN